MYNACPIYCESKKGKWRSVFFSLSSLLKCEWKSSYHNNKQGSCYLRVRVSDIIERLVFFPPIDGEFLGKNFIHPSIVRSSICPNELFAFLPKFFCFIFKWNFDLKGKIFSLARGFSLWTTKGAVRINGVVESWPGIAKENKGTMIYTLYLSLINHNSREICQYSIYSSSSTNVIRWFAQWAADKRQPTEERVFSFGLVNFWPSSPLWKERDWLRFEDWD